MENLRTLIEGRIDTLVISGEGKKRPLSSVFGESFDFMVPVDIAKDLIAGLDRLAFAQRGLLESVEIGVNSAKNYSPVQRVKRAIGIKNIGIAENVRKMSLCLKYPQEYAYSDLFIFWLTLKEHNMPKLEMYRRSLGMGFRPQVFADDAKLASFAALLDAAQPIDSKGGLKIVRQLLQG